jgi:hypothetical protein
MKRFLALFLPALVLALPAQAQLLPNASTNAAPAGQAQQLDRIVAVVNEDVILQSELDNAVRSIQQQYASQPGQLPPMNVLQQQVLDRLILMKLQLQGRLGLDGVVNFAYRYRRGLMEQYSVSAVYPLSERWRLIGAWTYAKPIKGVVNPLKGTIEALAGVEYDSCCVTLRLVDRSYVNQAYYGTIALPTTPGRTNLRDNAVMFEVVFKGLGSSGGQIDPLLHRDILGYQ